MKIVLCWYQPCRTFAPILVVLHVSFLSYGPLRDRQTKVQDLLSIRTAVWQCKVLCVDVTGSACWWHDDARPSCCLLHASNSRSLATSQVWDSRRRHIETRCVHVDPVTGTVQSQASGELVQHCLILHILHCG